MSGPEQGQDHSPDPQDLVEDYFMGRLSAEEAASHGVVWRSSGQRTQAGLLPSSTTGAPRW